ALSGLLLLQVVPIVTTAAAAMTEPRGRAPGLPGGRRRLARTALFPPRPFRVFPPPGRRGRRPSIRRDRAPCPPTARRGSGGSAPGPRAPGPARAERDRSGLGRGKR